MKLHKKYHQHQLFCQMVVLIVRSFIRLFINATSILQRLRFLAKVFFCTVYVRMKLRTKYHQGIIVINFLSNGGSDPPFVRLFIHLSSTLLRLSCWSIITPPSFEEKFGDIVLASSVRLSVRPSFCPESYLRNRPKDFNETWYKCLTL